MGRGGGQVVSVHAFYSDDPSSSPAGAYRYHTYMKLFRVGKWRVKDKHKWAKVHLYQSVWPDKNRQMSIKVAQKWFH